MSENKEYTLAEIAKHTDSIVVGDSMAIVNNLSTIELASSDSLSFLSNKSFSSCVDGGYARNKNSFYLSLDRSFRVPKKRKIGDRAYSDFYKLSLCL